MLTIKMFRTVSTVVLNVRVLLFGFITDNVPTQIRTGALTRQRANAELQPIRVCDLGKTSLPRLIKSMFKGG